MDLNLLFKILIIIVVVGIVIKITQFLGSMIFKIALIGLCILFLYKLLLAI